MAKVKVNFDIKKQQIITERIGEAIGKRAVSMAKKMIANGQSPVRNVGRFERYAAQRASASVVKLRKNFKSKKARAASTKLIAQREKGKYPKTKDIQERFPSKKVRPVNLSLNGWYLSHLTYWLHKSKLQKLGASLGVSASKFKTNYKISIGFSGTEGKKTRVPKKVKQFFEAHNEGLNDKVPQRKHLPTGQNEEFSVSIMREIKKIIERRVKNLVIAENNKNKKR